MSRSHILLFAVSIIASIVVSTKASLAVADLTHRIKKLEWEIVKVHDEKELLKTEIKGVESQLNEMTKQYEAKLSSSVVTLENEKENIKKLSFLTGRLIEQKNEQNSTFLYLKGLSKNVRYSLALIQQEIEILQNRRSVGMENECFFYYKQPINNFAESLGQKSKISSRSLTDDTPEILALVSTHDLIRSDLSSALNERDRLKLLLEQKKELLAGNMKSFQAEINEKLRTLSSVQEKSQSLQELAKYYKSVVETLRLKNRELHSTILQDQKLFSNFEQSLNSEFKKPKECYTGIIPRTQSHFQKFLRYKKTYDEIIGGDLIDGEVINAEDDNKNHTTANSIINEVTTITL